MARATLPPLHRFADARLAQVALTHKSFGAPHNERMEWLGDAVLQVEISRLLYARFPDVNEAGLSQVRTRLVNTKTLAAVAKRHGLGAAARIGRPNMRDGRDNEKFLAALLEAYIAAVLLDGGDAGALVTALFEEDIAALGALIDREGMAAMMDAKTRLQNALQQKKCAPPAYRLVSQRGKANAPTFVIECRAGAVHARASGRTRAAAEQLAAADCLAQLQ